MSVSQRVVLILFTASLLGGVATGNRLYYQLSYLWALVYFGSWIWSTISLRGLTLRRTAKALRAQVGQIFEERFDLVNQGRIPRLWVEVRDESSLPGAEGSRVLTMIEGRQGRSYLARTRLLRRGVFALGPTALSSCDIFGLFPRERQQSASEALLVYPMMVDIENLPNPAGLLAGGEALRRRTHQITPNASGVREYVHGDALSRIHWLSSARRDQLMVKEFELDPLADVWIFLDGYRMAHIQQQAPEVEEHKPTDLWQKDYKPQLPPSTEEYAICAAASFARAYLRQGRALGLVSAGKHMTLLPPDRGGRQLGKVLEALALLQADGHVPLTALIEAQAKHIVRGSTVVLITPGSTSDYAVMSDFLLRRGLKPVAVLIQASSFGPAPDTEQLEFRLKTLGIPVRKVARGDDMQMALSAVL